jgi:hypothetical protein
MDVEYVPNGPEGKTCAECVNFRPNPEDSSEGICFGREVVAAGSCNFFRKMQTPG